MRIRILRSLATTRQVYSPGMVVDVDDKTARAWLNAGVAELDKSLDGPAEVKQDDPAADSPTDTGASDGGGGQDVPEGGQRRGKRNAGKSN